MGKSGKAMHVFTTRGLLACLAAAMVAGGMLGLGATRVANTPEAVFTAAQGVPVPSVSPTGYAVPTGTPNASLPATEDMPGWDCRAQGNRVCKIDGELWLNLAHLPSSPYERCGLGLSAVSIDPRWVGLAAPELCEPIFANGG